MTSFRRLEAAVSAGTGFLAFAVYAQTAARTITWWEGASYPLAAMSLGIQSPPGSLLLTVLGWLWLRLPLAGEPAFRLALLAGLIAACTTALVALLAIRLGGREDPLAVAGGALAGLAFAFALTPWTHAVRFTPYVLTAAFTAAIALVALAWARDGRSSRLFVLFLLLGLDVSVHRTNLLLLPAVALWLALHRARVRPAPIVLGLGLGLAFHLLLIPLARRDPWYDLGHPVDFASFVRYVRLDQVGGGFLFGVWPRRAPVVAVQLADYAKFLRANFSWAALALAAAGVIAGFRAAPRRTLGLLASLLCASLGAVAYFNLPEGYFRPLDRHYLASLVLFAPWIGVGAAALLRALPRWTPAFAFAVLLALVPGRALLANRAACDLSRMRFAGSYARNVLNTLPPEAVLFTNGDNDTFPLWYAQRVLGVRRDVSVLNLPMCQMPYWVEHLGRLDPRFAGIAAPAQGYAQLTDTTVVVGADSLRLATGGVRPSSDAVVLEVLRRMGRTRPICVACTVPEPNLPWLFPHLAPEGLSFRLTTTPDLAAFRHRMLDVVDYAGVGDRSLRLDATTRMMLANEAAALARLAADELQAGRPAACLQVVAFARSATPWDRLGYASDPFAAVESAALAQRH